jgi:hypothetical protein
VRRAVAAAVTSVLCSLALTACSNGADTATPARPSTTSPSTAPTTTHPDTSQRPTEPVMPALAKRHSTAGAKAFIRYFVAVLNYSFEAPDPRALVRLTTSDCTFCKSLILVTARLKRDGRRQTHGDWRDLKLMLTGHDAQKLVFLVTGRIHPGYTQGGTGGARHAIKGGKLVAEIHVEPSIQRWRVSYLEPR